MKRQAQPVSSLRAVALRGPSPPALPHPHPHPPPPPRPPRPLPLPSPAAMGPSLSRSKRGRGANQTPRPRGGAAGEGLDKPLAHEVGEGGTHCEAMGG